MGLRSNVAHLLSAADVKLSALPRIEPLLGRLHDGAASLYKAATNLQKEVRLVLEQLLPSGSRDWSRACAWMWQCKAFSGTEHASRQRAMSLAGSGPSTPTRNFSVPKSVGRSMSTSMPMEAGPMSTVQRQRALLEQRANVLRYVAKLGRIGAGYGHR
jgi:hypothetical protein